MRIGIDARELERPNTGVGSYVVNLIKALGDLDHSNQYFIYVNDNFQPSFDLPLNFCIYKLNLKRIKRIQYQYVISKVISECQLDLFHVTHHDVTAFFSNIPLVVTVHDISWIDFPSSSYIFQKYYYFITYLAMHKASRIITVSNYTSQRVQHYFNFVTPKIQAIPIACDSFFKPINNNDIFNSLHSEFSLSRPYVLYVGSFAARKNLTLLIRAMQLVYKEMPMVQLVLAGKPSGRDDISFSDFSINFPLVLINRSKTQDELQCLYTNASMLIFPSYYEGFGLPVLEAMSCGCPVIAANTTSLKEVIGDAGILIDPNDPLALAVQIIKLLRDSSLREKMFKAGLTQAKKFNWSLVAEKTIETYRHVLK